MVNSISEVPSIYVLDLFNILILTIYAAGSFRSQSVIPGMNICKALVKHGYSNFELTILEYCSPDKCLIREKHYWNIFKPEYNIAQDPSAPMSGRYSF